MNPSSRSLTFCLQIAQETRPSYGRQPLHRNDLGPRLCPSRCGHHTIKCLEMTTQMPLAQHPHTPPDWVKFRRKRGWRTGVRNFFETSVLLANLVNRTACCATVNSRYLTQIGMDLSRR